jgi:two-component system, OmpR family, sensor kinase
VALGGAQGAATAAGLPRLPRDLRALAASGRAQNVAVRGRAQLRLLAIRADAGTLVARVSLSQVSNTIGRIKAIVALGSAAAALLVALGVGLIMRRGLRPIETMANQADRITAGDLTDRVGPQDAQTEVGRPGTALNGMLARIQASVGEREASQELTRRFFADASHELRNPLASLRANAELYQQGALPDRPQVDEAMRRIALEAQRMSGLVDDMLRLARLDQRPERQHDPVDLTALATGCVERAQLADPERTWQTHIAPVLVAAGDEELLRRAIDNLLANVRAHPPAGTVAAITAITAAGHDTAAGHEPARHDRSVTIEVSDNGPGVQADQLCRIFDRFYRAAALSDLPGSGLGLAIVAAIAATHNGTAHAALNEPHGLRITLTLPAFSQDQPAEESALPVAGTSAQVRQPGGGRTGERGP